MLFKTLLSYLKNEHDTDAGDVFPQMLKRLTAQKKSGNKIFNFLYKN